MNGCQVIIFGDERCGRPTSRQYPCKIETENGIITGYVNSCLIHEGKFERLRIEQ